MMVMQLSLVPNLPEGDASNRSTENSSGGSLVSSSSMIRITRHIGLGLTDKKVGGKVAGKDIPS